MAWFLGLFSSWAIWLLVGIGTTVVGGCYYYYEHTQSQLQILSANVAKSEVAIKEQQYTISALQAFSKEQKITVESFQTQTALVEDSAAKTSADIRDIHITAQAQINRPQLEIKLNNQLNDLFKSVGEISNANKKHP
jgi:hypothetical protein